MYFIRWSEEKAFNYMKQNAPYADSDARTEINRYITWPGQVISYFPISYSMSNIAPYANSDARTEINWYITWPGQVISHFPISYLMSNIAPMPIQMPGQRPTGTSHGQDR